MPYLDAFLDADFKTIPYIHQAREFENSGLDRSRALFWQMRTGKSKLIVDSACALYRAGAIDTVLVFAPNGVHENWIRRELPIHHWESVERATFYWQTDLMKENERLDYLTDFKATLFDKHRLAWFSFANATMIRDDVRKLVKRILRNRKSILVVFDESHDFRIPSSKRTQMGRAVANACEFKRILSGTPLDNSPLHAYSQFELLEKEALDFPTYEAFKEYYAIYEETKVYRGGREQTFPKLVDYRNLPDLTRRIQPYTSVLLRTDCADLPAVVPKTISLKMTDEQQAAHMQMLKRFEVELSDGRIVTMSEKTQRLNKLQQIASGFMYDQDRKLFRLPGRNPKIDQLREEVRLAPGKVIVWCHFQEDIDRACEVLRADGHEVVEYHGRVSAKEKARVRELFAPGAENDVKVLVGQAQSGGSGLDFSSAGLIIWFSHTFNAIDRSQADERATAIGGSNIPILDLECGPTDQYVRDVTKQKTSLGALITREGFKELLKRLEL